MNDRRLKSQAESLKEVLDNVIETIEDLEHEIEILEDKNKELEEDILGL